MKQGKKERGVNKGDSKRGFQRGQGGTIGENPIGETKALALSKVKTKRPYYSILGLPLSDSDGFDRPDLFQLANNTFICYGKRKYDKFRRVNTDKMFLIRFDGFLADPVARLMLTNDEHPFIRVSGWEEFESHIRECPSFDFLFRWCGICAELFEVARANPNIQIMMTIDSVRYFKEVGGVLVPDEIRQAKAKYNMSVWESLHPNQINRVREVYEYNHKGE